MPASAQRFLFLGLFGHVVAVEKSTGATIWDTSLPNTGFSVVSIVYEDDRLFCASGGRAFALDPRSGEILWTNELPGLGSGPVFLATASSSPTLAAQTTLAAQDAQTRTATTGTADAAS